MSNAIKINSFSRENPLVRIINSMFSDAESICDSDPESSNYEPSQEFCALLEAACVCFSRQMHISSRLGMTKERSIELRYRDIETLKEFLYACIHYEIIGIGDQFYDPWPGFVKSDGIDDSLLAGHPLNVDEINNLISRAA